MSQSQTNSETASRRATYQDVLDAPPHLVAEVVDGKLYTQRPAIPHQFATSRLNSLIGLPFDLGENGPGGWWILYKPEIHLDDDILVPDTCGWNRERMPAIEAGDYITLAPDWVCEVLSPETEKLDRGGKQEAYAREGVSHLWIADPADKTLEAFQLIGAEWELVDRLDDDALVSLPPFEAISFNLVDLWPPAAVRKGTATI